MKLLYSLYSCWKSYKWEIVIPCELYTLFFLRFLSRVEDKIPQLKTFCVPTCNYLKKIFYSFYRLINLITYILSFRNIESTIIVGEFENSLLNAHFCVLFPIKEVDRTGFCMYSFEGLILLATLFLRL